jgi:hypothetical protein
MTTYGEVTWNDDGFGDGKKNANNKDIWLRLDEGSNELRLVTQPFQYLTHRYKKDETDKFGQKVPCSAIHGSCPLCAHPDKEIAKVRRRWLLGVISRKTSTYKVLDISWAVFSEIKNLNQKAHWGDPLKYDIDITVNKNGGPMDYYKVVPLSKEPLSASDQVIKDDADLDDLKKRCNPPSPENVQKRLDKINGVEGTTVTKGSGKASPAAPAARAAPAAPVVSLEDDEELEKSFPDYVGPTT